MLYVLKNVGLGAGTIPHFLEHFYDEVVTVRNDIALVKFEHNKNAMLGMNFVQIGMIESEKDLPALLGKDPTVELKVRKEVKKIVDIESIMKPQPAPQVEGAQKSWYENIE